MFRKALILTAIVLVFSACQAQAAVIDSNWVSCDNGFWSDTNNWDPNIVPDNNATDSYSVTIDTRSCSYELEVRIRQNRTIDDLSIYGDVDLESYVRENITDIVLAIVEDLDVTLTLENALTNYGELEIANLIIEGNIVNHAHSEISEVDMTGDIANHNYLELDQTDMEGNVTNMQDATLEFQFPSAEINGNLYNLAGGTTEVQSLAEIKEGNIDNAGLVLIYPLGQMMFENHFNNTGQILPKGGSLLYWDEENGPGVFDNNSTGLIKGFGTLDTGKLLRNKGTVHAFGGSLAIEADRVINEGIIGNVPASSLHVDSPNDVNNFGTIEVNAGGGVVFDPNLVNDSDGIIKLRGGNLAAASITQTADANTFEGFGSITGDVFIESGAEINLTGPTNIVGDVSIPASATLEISDGTTLVTGDCTCNNGTIHMIGGRIIIQGEFTNNNCEIIWEPGLYTNVADFNLDGTVNMKDFAFVADTWLWQTAWLTQ